MSTVALRLEISGLDVLAPAGADGRPAGLIAVNPSRPESGTASIRRNGRLLLARWCRLETGTGALDTARIITGFLAGNDIPARTVPLLPASRSGARHIQQEERMPGPVMIFREELTGDATAITATLDDLAEAGINDVEPRLPAWYRALTARLAAQDGLKVWIVVFDDGETELEVVSATYPHGGDLAVSLHPHFDHPGEVVLTWEGTVTATSDADQAAICEIASQVITVADPARSTRRMDP